MRFEPFSPQRLREIRKEAGLTQKQLAAGAGLPLVTLKKIEAGTHKPGVDKLQAIGKFLGLYLYAEWKKEEDPGK